MCDEGRFSYKAIHADTRLLHPQVRQGDVLAPTSWQEALQYATALLQRHGSNAVGVLVAPQGTNEDGYVLARFIAEACPARRMWCSSPVRRAMKTIFSCGQIKIRIHAVRRIWACRLRPRPPSCQPWRRQLSREPSKSCMSLTRTCRQPSAAERRLGWLTARLDGLIVQASHWRAGYEQAQVMLPSTMPAERDGTFTNFQGHVQRINAAIRPRGEAQPAWHIYTRLAHSLGQSWPYTAAETILADIALPSPAIMG